jgi:probable addiction module antidote protein
VPLKLKDFDPARYLETEEDVAEYLNSMLEEGNTELLVAALGEVARARGMSEIARFAPKRNRVSTPSRAFVLHLD